MFFLDEQHSKLASVNPRSELNGADHRLACDLKFDLKMSNDILSVFDPKLKAAFYEKYDEDQGELIEAPNHLTKLKFVLGGALNWSEEFTGYTVIVNYGIGGPSDIKLGDVKVNKFSFDCQQGGTVNVSLRVQAHPEAEDIGKLCTLIQQEVKITLRPANDVEQAETAERTEAREELHGLFSENDDAEDPRADFDEDPLAGSDLAGTSEPDDPIVDEDEARYTEAIAFVRTLCHVSISKVTRKFKCTEIVASRILQRMEDDGIVNEAGNNGVRDVVAVAA